MWKKYSKHSAVYRTQSKIHHLQVLVTLKPVISLIEVPVFEKFREDGESVLDGGGGGGGGAGGDDGIEEVIVGWQEKILSRYEIEFYREIENCSSDVQKEYHKWIVQDGLDEHIKFRKRVFTYVMNDNFVLQEKITEGMDADGGATYGHHIHEEIMKHGQLSDDEEVMYIYANLNPDTLLFYVRWSPSENVLVVYPDFNDFNENPYYVEIDTDIRHLYAYSIKNISKTRELEHVNNFNIPRIRGYEDHLTPLFNMPPKRRTRILFLFEIESAHDFEYDNIHVRYNVVLPNGLSLETGNLIGSTHSSKCFEKSWKFGYCFHLCLITDEDFKNENSSVKILFESISIDSWDRERTEGYGSMQLYLHPRIEQFSLQCFRFNYGFMEKIERYFIGGRRKIKLDSFNNGENRFLNRYGCKTISTGKLNVKVQIITQSNPNLLGQRPLIRERKGGITLDDIMKAYQEARKRLEATSL